MAYFPLFVPGKASAYTEDLSIRQFDEQAGTLSYL
jgi:hypothetical protein